MYLIDQCAVKNEKKARSSRCCAVFGHFLYCFASFDSHDFKFSATSDRKSTVCVAEFCAMSNTGSSNITFQEFASTVDSNKIIGTFQNLFFANFFFQNGRNAKDTSQTLSFARSLAFAALSCLGRTALFIIWHKELQSAAFQAPKACKQSITN